MLRIRLELAMRAAAYKSRDNSIGVGHVSGIYVIHRRICRQRAGTGGFSFYDARERDITQTVLTALRGLTE